MPISEMDLIDVVKALEGEVRLNDQEKTLRGNMYFQCVVNCKGKAGDFQIIHCPDELINIGCQALNVLHEQIINWVPGRQSSKDLDVLITIKATFSKGSYELIAYELLT